MTAAGRELYIVTNPKDVTMLFRNTASLTFDTYIREMMVAIGVKSSGVDKWWHAKAIEGKPGSRKPSFRIPAHVGESYVKSHLNPGAQLDHIQIDLLNRVSYHLSPEGVPLLLRGRNVLQDPEEISLYWLCREVLVDAATRTFFGDSLMDTEPDSISHFAKFDDLNWQFILKYPAALSQEMLAGREKVMQALKSYYKRPLGQRKDASELILNLEKEMRAQELDEDDMAALSILTFWAYGSHGRTDLPFGFLS